MAFRTVIISSHSKLEYSLGYLVFKSNDDTKRILINEIHTLIINTTMCAITSSLLSELIKNKVNVLFCDEKQNPESQLLPLNNSCSSFGKIKEQLSWNIDFCKVVWKEIIKEKIKGESINLYNNGFKTEAEKLNTYICEVEDGDTTNREGHAAKIYFNKIFHKGFSRQNDDIINKYLNYGYSIILSLFNRTIASLGYLTQIGIHHIGESNPFNLSCDLMEPFRVFVDIIAATIKITDDFKEVMTSILEKTIKINGKMQTINNAITIYVQSIFTSLINQDISYLVFPDSYVF